MTAQPKLPRMTADEFFAWVADQPEKRYELVDGYVFAMSPERLGHTRTKQRIVVSLSEAIERAGLGCEAITDGVSVRIGDGVVYEPDALVRCGPPAPDDAIEIDDPVIVVEVVSPSSHNVDTGRKLAAYFRLPSVRHYLVVQTEPGMVTHHRRDDAGDIATRILRDGTLSLDPPGLTVEIADFFAAP